MDVRRRLRLNLLRHLNELSPEFHESTPLGEKFYRLQKDVDQVSDIGGDFAPYFLRMTFNMFFIVATLLILSFRLTCIVLPLIPLLLILKKRFRDTIRELSEVAHQKSNLAYIFLQEHLGAILQVQLLRRERTQTKLFAHFSADATRALKARRSAEIAFSYSCLLVVVFGTVAVLAYGGHQVLIGSLTIGGFVAFYSYLGRLFDAMNGAVEVYSRLNRIGTSILRIVDIIQLEPTLSEHPCAITPSGRLMGSIRMRSATFAYSNRLPLLRNLDLTISEGEKVALVGISGSGKSTILKLIARVYDVKEGGILLGGIDVRQIKRDALRKQVIYLPQEAVLFNRSLRENLLLGNPDASDEQLEEAIRSAALNDSLTTLDRGWDTQLGAQGGRLSVGEKQRLAIARALLQEPQVLLLDESTSAVDIPTEKLIFQNLARHFRNRTLVLVSHRISALEWVDRIIVLDNGAIQEQGTHDQLIRNDGLYRVLHGTLITVHEHQQ